MTESLKQSEVETPHFRLPFRFGGLHGAAFVNEQDSEDDLVDCVKAIVAYPEGSRVDHPDFGTPELAFRERVEDVVAFLHGAISQWEPRANTLVESVPDFDSFLYHLFASISTSGDV